jgi:hypothetical protein
MIDSRNYTPVNDVPITLVPKDVTITAQDVKIPIWTLWTVAKLAMLLAGVSGE